MIKNIQYLDDDGFCFFKGTKFHFKPLTLLVGDQGCGKSTILSVLKKKESHVKFVCDDQEQTKIQHINFDKDTPDKDQGNPFGPSGDLLYVLQSKFRSHGENILPIISYLNDSNDTLILLDEPETALSPRSINILIETIENALTRNNQIVIATHNVMLMQKFQDCILSLEHQKYMTFDAFMKTQQSDSNFKEIREHKIVQMNNCILGNDCKCAAETGWYNKRTNGVPCEFAIQRGMKTSDVKKLAKSKGIKLA